MKTMHTALITAALLSFGAQCGAATSQIPAGLVPESHKVVDTIRGDLNGDGRDDMVLLIKARDRKGLFTDEQGGTVDRNRRGLVIALRNGDRYEPVLKNLNCVSSENEDGGVYFAPELSVSSRKGNLLIEYSHGRYGYWTYTFRYRNSAFELIGYDSSSNSGPVVDRFISINLLTSKVLKKVNTNADAQGGDERFRESWLKVPTPRRIALADIEDFDELSVERMLGLSR